MRTIELPDGELNLTVDFIPYIVSENGDNKFTIMEDDENIADVKLSKCGEFYEHHYSPLYKDFDDCSGSVPVNQFDSIVQYFIWVIRNV